MTTPTPHPPAVVPVLALAIAAVSAAAVLVRLAPGVHPVAAAFWRTAIVGVLLSPGIQRVRAGDAGRVLLAGAFLAAHFWVWFASIHLTTVVRSTVLVCLSPIWAGLLEGWLGHPPPRRYWWGVALAVVGVGVMSGLVGGGTAGAEQRGGALAGDSLALLGGGLSAAYLVTGRRIRQRVPIRSYGALVCLAAAGWLALAAGVTGASLTGFPDREWLALVGLALGPQLLGHNGLNYAVGYVSAALVSALLLLEPVGAGALAWLALGEVPGRAELGGGALILIGIGIATVTKRRRRVVEETTPQEPPCHES